MEKKKSRVIPAMAAISLIIIILGAICAIAFYSAVTHEIAQGADTSLIVGGIDAAAVAGHAGNAGAAVLAVMIGLASLALVALQWLGYLVVKIIASLFAKKE